MSASIDAVVHSVFATAKNFDVSPIQLAATTVGSVTQMGYFCRHPEIPLPHETDYTQRTNKFHAITHKIGKTYMARRGFGTGPCLDAYFLAGKIVKAAAFCIAEGDFTQRSLSGLWSATPIDVLKIAALNVRTTLIARAKQRMEEGERLSSLPFVLKDMATKAMREVVYERAPFRGAVLLPVIAAYTATTQPVTAMNVTDAIARHMGGRPAALLRLQQTTCHS